MLLADHEVVGIVGRGYLERPGAEVGGHVRVADDGQFPADQRQEYRVVGQILIAGVVGVHRHRGIAQESLGPGGGHHQIALAVLKGVADVVEPALDLLVLALQVAQGGVAAGAPVDDVVAPVDEPFLVQAHEHLAHRLGQALVHGEALPAPVAGSAQALELVYDLAAVLGPPFPHPINKGLPAQVVAGLAFGSQLALHHVLGGDARVVGSRHPQHLVAQHALVAAHDVLHGVVERVAHVQLPGHVGRRDHDGVGRALACWIGGEQPLPLPVGVPTLFHLSRLIRFG